MKTMEPLALFEIRKTSNIIYSVVVDVFKTINYIAYTGLLVMKSIIWLN